MQVTWALDNLPVMTTLAVLLGRKRIGVIFPPWQLTCKVKGMTGRAGARLRDSSAQQAIGLLPNAPIQTGLHTRPRWPLQIRSDRDVFLRLEGIDAAIDERGGGSCGVELQ